MTPPIWKWAPNWASGVSERLEWKTAIQTSRDGRETRHRLRPMPRTAISFQCEVHDTAYHDLSMQVQANQVDEWIMPIWWDPSELVVVSASALVFDASDRDFGRYPGWAWAVLVHPQTGRFGSVQIAKGMGGAWDLKDPINPNDWPVGTRIFPARRVLLSASQPLLQVTAGVVRLGVECRVLDNKNHTKSATPIHLEMREPNRLRPVSAGVESMVGALDFGVGVFSQKDYAGRPARTATHDYVLFSREELSQMRADLALLSGRLGTLRVPTFQSDRRATVDMDPLWIYLWSKPAGYEQLFDRGVDLYIKPLNGQAPVIARPYGVNSGDPLGDEIEFDPPLPMHFKKDEVKISLVYNSRLASDTVEIRHITPEISEISLSFRSVK